MEGNTYDAPASFARGRCQTLLGRPRPTLPEGQTDLAPRATELRHRPQEGRAEVHGFVLIVLQFVFLLIVCPLFSRCCCSCSLLTLLFFCCSPGFCSSRVPHRCSLFRVLFCILFCWLCLCLPALSRCCCLPVPAFLFYPARRLTCIDVWPSALPARPAQASQDRPHNPR